LRQANLLPPAPDHFSEYLLDLHGDRGAG
jgi:hypothetical protein